MDSVIRIIVVAITAFVATNVDDILVLVVFLAQVEQRQQLWQIVLGQYLGFGALLLASLPGYLGGLVIPKSWLGLLGILPIMIGIRAFWQGQEHTTVPMVRQRSSDRRWQRWLSPQVLQVAAVTFANGGDNIGIYVPLFAQSRLMELILTLFVFLTLVAVWCALAYALTRQPTIAPLLSRYAHQIVPFVLIGLGVYIIWESGTWQLWGTPKSGLLTPTPLARIIYLKNF
jgi:cadmium resistance transport/sequestration family protein